MRPFSAVTDPAAQIQGRDLALSCVRVSATILILLCHLSPYLGYPNLELVFNVGVHVFLLLSGCLMGAREITRRGKWMADRLRRIGVPLYAFMAVLLVLYTVFGVPYTPRAVISCLLNLQGVGWVLRSFGVATLPGMGHLWFLTVIMLCYLLTLPADRIRRRWKPSGTQLWFALGIAVAAQCILAYCNIVINYFIIYFAGYFAGAFLKRLSLKHYVFLTSLLAAAMAVRLLGRAWADGTPLYNIIITELTHDVLAIWIFATICLAARNLTTPMNRLSRSRIFAGLDKLSLYLYMTHFMFLAGPFPIDFSRTGPVCGVLLFLMLTVISAAVLRAICGGIYGGLSKISQRQKAE